MRRIIGGSVVLLVILVLGVGQLLLPGIAASLLRSRLAASGRVESVSVSAFPAIELLWHHASKVVVRMADYHSGTGHLESLLDQVGEVGTIQASIGTLQAGSLVLTDVTMHKSGGVLVGHADVTEAAIRAAYPILESVAFGGSSGGTITLRGTADIPLLGPVTLPATVKPSDGAIEVVPDIPIVGGLGTVTVFSDPHVAVQGVSGAATGSGLSLTVTGRLR